MIKLLGPAILMLAAMVPPSLVAQTSADSGTFIIRRARDTVATERFTRTATRLDGTLAIHNAKQSSQRFVGVIAPDATVPLIEVTVREGPDSGPVKARVVQRARVIFKEDSVAVDDLGSNGLTTRLFETERGAVPYLNLSFALLEQAVRRARVGGGVGEIAFFNLGGGQTRTGHLSRLTADSLRLEIGDVQFHLRVDNAGRILGARIPKQEVIVDRR